MSRLSSPKPRMRHGRRHAYLFSQINLFFPSFCHRFFSHLPFLTFPTVPSLGVSIDLRRLPKISLFVLLAKRPWVAEPQTTCLTSNGRRAQKLLIPLCACPSLTLNFSRLPQTSTRLLPLAQTKSLSPC